MARKQTAESRRELNGRSESGSSSLRSRAQQLLDQASRGSHDVDAEGFRALVYELEVYQTELELQNEELRSTQVTLLEAQDRIAELQDLSPVSFVTLAGEHLKTVQHASLAAANLLGRTRMELVGTQWTRLIHRDDQDTWYQSHLNLQDGLQSCSCELRIGQPPDQKSVQVDAVAIRDDDGAMQSLHLTLTDLTERRASEQRLQQQSDDLERSRQNLLSLLEDQRVVQSRLEKKRRATEQSAAQAAGRGLHV